MVKILHIIGDSKYGGGSKVVIQLAQMARDQGWEPEVLATDPYFQEKLKEQGIPVVSLDCIWRPIRPVKDILGFYRLYRFLRRSGYSVVHTHTSKAGFVGRAAAWYAKIPVIIHTVHGFAFHEESSPIALGVYSRLEKIAARWCHCLVTVSNFHRKWALELGIAKPDKIVAIPNGISEEDVKPGRAREEVRKELGLDREKVMLLTMGRLAPQKGIKYLLQALKKLKGDDGSDNFAAFIVGKGPMEKNLKDMAIDLGLEKYVRFLGFRPDIGDLLEASDIVVLPSLWEGLSIALLEAMAAGKPIITTSIGSNKEATDEGEAAILVPAKDSESLCMALKNIIGSSEKRSFFSEKSKRKFSSCYLVNKNILLYRDLYLSMLRNLT